MKTSITSLAAVTLALLVSQASIGLGQSEWPQFRGPNANGIASAPDVPTQITENDYLWATDLPGLGHGSPVHWQDHIYVTSEVEEAQKRQLVCVDAASGKVKWTHSESFEKPDAHHRLNSYAATTPAVDKHGVYVAWISGDTLVAFGMDHEGNEKWRREIPCGFTSKFGPGTSPIALDGRLILSNEHAGAECFLIAFDTQTGKTVWKVPRRTGLVSYCTPKVHRPNSGPVQIIFASTEHGVTSVDAQSGEVHWELPCDFTLKPCATPSIDEGIAFVTTGKGSAGVETVAVRLPDVTQDEQPEVAYRCEARLPYVPTTLAYDGKFLLWNDAGAITCIDAKTGEPVWDGRIRGTFYASPIMVDGRIYNTDVRGKMHVIASDRFEVLGEHQLADGTEATPAIVGGKMYVRTFGQLICIGK